MPGEEVKHEVTWNYYNRDETLIRAGTLFVEGVLPLTENEIRIDSIPFQAGSGLVAEGSNAIAEERLKESALEIVIDYSKSMLDDIGRQKNIKSF